MKTTVPFGYSWPYRWKRASSALISVRSRGGLPRTPCGNQASVALSRRNRETPTSSPIQPLSRTGSQPSELPEIAQGQGIAGPRSQHLLKSPLRHLQLFAGEGVDAPLEIFDRRAIGCGGHTQTTKLVDRYRHLLSAHLCTTELTGRYLAPDRVIGRFRDQNAGLIVLIETLQPRRKVHRISHHRVIEAEVGPHVADDHWPGVDSHPNLELGQTLSRPEAFELANLLDEPDCRAAGVKGMIRLLQRGSPESHQRISDVLVERPALLKHDLGQRNHGG